MTYLPFSANPNVPNEHAHSKNQPVLLSHHVGQIEHSTQGHNKTAALSMRHVLIVLCRVVSCNKG